MLAHYNKITWFTEIAHPTFGKCYSWKYIMERMSVIVRIMVNNYDIVSWTGKNLLSSSKNNKRCLFGNEIDPQTYCLESKALIMQKFW